MDVKKEKARFAAGCFWGVQKEFDKIKGVISTSVGYSGGKSKNPIYEEVGSGKTGHAESIEIVFDSSKVSYEKLLDVFWKIHDPTTPNRQGLDIGSQYRSIIFYANKDQKNIAVKSKNQKQKKSNKKIVTEIIRADRFYPAEEYHQKYYQKHKILGQVC